MAVRPRCRVLCGTGETKRLYVLILAIRQRPSELSDRILLTLIADTGEVSGQFQAHPLASAHVVVAGTVQILEKVTDVDVQHARQFIQSPGRDAIDAAFVLVRLLIGDPDHVGQLLLRQPQQGAALANAQPDMALDIARS